MIRASLLGQLSRVQLGVVAGACVLLVFSTMAASALLLRNAQDRTLEAMAVELANGVLAEAQDEKLDTVAAAQEYFEESRLEGFRFEILDREGHLAGEDGKLPNWEPDAWVVKVDSKAGSPVLKPGAAGKNRFRACARFCGTRHVVRVVTGDVLQAGAVRRAAVILLAALPVAIAAGAFVGRLLFRRALRPLGRLEAAALASGANPDVRLDVDTSARELASLRDAFNGLLSRLGEALERERRFAQDASHELRTPLTALRGRMERLAEGAGARSEVGERLHAMLREIDALDRLVDALLLVARSESAPLPTTPVNLCDLARDVVRRRAGADPNGSRPPEIEAPDEVLVRGSEELLATAISGLVDNARKFAGSGGRILVTVAGDTDWAKVVVADDGPGIADAEQPRVFDRFFRGAAARADVRGAGLGLAVARAVAVRHRGSIEATRSAWGGAEFRIRIPRLQQGLA